MVSQEFRLSSVMVLALFSLGVAQCDPSGTSPSPQPTASPVTLSSSDERLIVLLQTNDLHGGVESKLSTINGKDVRSGGMAILGGIVQSIRQGIANRFKENGGVLVVDAGDQFQGTLISNFNEGQLMFESMNQVGYDAVVPGNHDYDFGPVGWLDDRVTSNTTDQNPRGALERLVSLAQFPLISANTFLRSSIVDTSGASVDVDNVGCAPKATRGSSKPLDFSRALNPSFVKPYVIKNVGGVRVALIGLDNASTPKTTTGVNVSDLCFADPIEIYLMVREKLAKQADVFVAVMHDGNSANEFAANRFAEKVGEKVDAIVAGHTHNVNKELIKGVPIVQSGANGEMFGRIDLVFDKNQGKVLKNRTQFYAGVQMPYETCAPTAEKFCIANAAAKSVAYEGIETTPDSRVAKHIESAKAELMVMAGRKLGTAKDKLWVNRIGESPLANALTDWFRDLSGAEIAMMNTGGLRTSIAKGDFTYEDLYAVLPFNNRGVVLSPMPFEKLMKLLVRSVRTCGSYGALMQSGLKIKFERTCVAGKDLDPKARLLRVETIKGEVLLDADKGILADSKRTFSVATLDFLADGGSGFDDFKGVPITKQVGIVREALADYLTQELQGTVQVSGKIDGRFKEVARPPECEIQSQGVLEDSESGQRGEPIHPGAPLPHPRKGGQPSTRPNPRPVPCQ